MRLPTIVISVVAILVVLLAAACAPAASPTPTQAPTPTPTNTPAPMPTPTSTPMAIAPTATPTPPAMGDVREIAIQAGSLRFSPAQINVKAGEKVRFAVTSTDSFHTFTSTVLGVDVSINGGETKTIEVTIPTGVTEIPFWCKPHQGAGMTGKLIVQGLQPLVATPTPTAVPTPTPTPTPVPTPRATPTPTVVPTPTATPVAIAQVNLQKNDTLGSFLTDAGARTLYLYTKDELNLSNCYDACAQRWPPLLTTDKPTAGEGVAAALLGTTHRKDGSTQVTYNGWPLYYWWQDAKPGDTAGQNVGKVWFVLTADGSAVQNTAPVKLTKNDTLGSFLADQSGRTLYIYTKDELSLSNCYDACAQRWPPLLTVGDPVAGDGAVQTLLGAIKRKDGSSQVTYNGWPLYYWWKDAKPGDTLGQNVGKVWFTLTADGAPVQNAAPVKLTKNDTLGSFLADQSGRTLYLYTKDELGMSNCYDACAQRWPPLLTVGAPVAGDGAVQTLLGTVKRKDGSMQVTYNGWPLYYWWKDAKPSDTLGQNVGKVWFTLTADGAPVQNNAPIKQVMNDVLGRFLADQSGRTLYMYTKDEPNVSNCYDACAQRWPPLLTVGAPTAGEGTLGAFLGVIKRKDGSSQVTYNGWPLYYWWKDVKPGDTLGQNVGKVWFVLAPDGVRIEIVPPATPAPTQQPGAATPTPVPTVTPTPTPAPAVREIKVTAKLPTFSPSSIDVKAGEKVRFVVTSTDMYHTFTVPDLGIDLQLDSGQTKSVEVTIPSGKAELQFYCDPHRFDGMVGKLVVTASQPMSDAVAPTPTPSYDYGGGY